MTRRRIVLYLGETTREFSCGNCRGRATHLNRRERFGVTLMRAISGEFLRDESCRNAEDEEVGDADK